MKETKLAPIWSSLVSHAKLRHGWATKGGPLKEYETKTGFKKNARFLLIDFNGEYSKEKSITQNKTIFNLSTRKELAKIKRKNKIPWYIFK